MKHPTQCIRNVQVWMLLLSVLALAIATSCASGPKPPEPGTPAFYWGAAKEAFRTGDFPKTDQHLQQILGSESEFTAKARAWDIIVSAGLAAGYAETADAFDAGARMNRANPTPFRKQAIAERTFSNTASVQFAENVHKFLDKDKDPKVTLSFTFPPGSFAPPGSLSKVASGMLIQDSERDSLQLAMAQRGVLQMVCRSLDSVDNMGKATEALKTGEGQVAREVFLWAVAQQMEKQSALYSPQKLDQPNRFIMMEQGALDAIKAIPATKDTKALAEKIQKAIDKLKKQPGV